MLQRQLQWWRRYCDCVRGDHISPTLERPSNQGLLNIWETLSACDLHIIRKSFHPCTSISHNSKIDIEVYWNWLPITKDAPHQGREVFENYYVAEKVWEERLCIMYRRVESAGWVGGYAKCKCATVSAYPPRDTPKCDSSSTLASALQIMDAHHSIGNSHVLFMIWGSSQVSFPVMLYPFSMMCQQYNQGPVPRQMSWSFASLMAHTPQWRSILLLKLLAHLCSLGLDRQASHASTSRPPQQSHCLWERIHLG